MSQIRVNSAVRSLELHKRRDLPGPTCFKDYEFHYFLQGLGREVEAVESIDSTSDSESIR